MRTQQMLASKACKLVIRCWFGVCYRSQGDVVAVHFVNKEFWLHCIIKSSDTLFIDPVNWELPILLLSSRKVFGECRPPPSNEKESWIQIVNLERHQHLEMSLITLSPYQHLLSTSANLLITLSFFAREINAGKNRTSSLEEGSNSHSNHAPSALTGLHLEAHLIHSNLNFHFDYVPIPIITLFFFFLRLRLFSAHPCRPADLNMLDEHPLICQGRIVIYSTELPPHQSASTHSPSDNQEITRQATSWFIKATSLFSSKQSCHRSTKFAEYFN